MAAVDVGQCHGGTAHLGDCLVNGGARCDKVFKDIGLFEDHINGAFGLQRLPDRVTDIIKAGLAAGDDFVNGENMQAEGGLDGACNVADRSCENLFGKRFVEVASCYQAKLCVQFGPAQKILRNGGEFLTTRHPLERRAGDCRVIKDHLPDRRCSGVVNSSMRS